MNIEIYIIRVLLQRELYIKYRKYVVLSKDSSRDLISLYQLLDNMMQDLQRDVTLNEFCLHVEQHQLADMLPALQDNSVPDDTIETLLEKLVAKQWAYEHACLAVEVHEGKKEITALLEHASESPVKGTLIKTPWVTTDVSQIQKAVDRSAGLKWRLQSLQNALGGLTRGDFGFIFARPETGKTTFLASQVTYFAAQSMAPVIWANNEERGEKVQSRLMQSALQMDRDRFLSLDPDLISAEYEKRTKGHLKLGDFARLHRSDIERICEEMHPALLVIDQIDKVKGFKADKKEVMLGELYQWTREMAKEYCPIIGVCQASASAENKKWLTMDDVAESKTTKAAEADFIIGVGKTHDEGQEEVRYLHLIKNKLTGNHARITCRIRADIGRYEDLV